MVFADVPPARLGAPSTPLSHLPFDEIPRTEWQRLLAATSAATPFSAWTFHRAWWDAYAATATDHYLVRHAADPRPLGAADDGRSLAAIVPLMTREAEPGSSAPLPVSRAEPSGPSEVASAHHAVGAARRTLYFAASYHADYATLLADPSDLTHLASDLARYLAKSLQAGHVDAVDLRRLARTDPALPALAQSFDLVATGLGLETRVEHEDVCPVVDLAGDWHTQLGRLDKKSRHEVRRKLRRAERAGPLELRYLPLSAASADRFIHLHQARWGSAGLFADGEDGGRSRLFLRRLAELEAAEGPAARFHLAELLVGDQPIYALAGFASGGICYFYNAGMDPDARDLSPGIVGTATYLRDRIERGDRAFDFLRGDEAYKYAWGATDRHLARLTLMRAAAT